MNSTADGGGVAELLHALLGTVASAGVRTMSGTNSISEFPAMVVWFAPTPTVWSSSSLETVARALR